MIFHLNVTTPPPLILSILIASNPIAPCVLASPHLKTSCSNSFENLLVLKKPFTPKIVVFVPTFTLDGLSQYNRSRRGWRHPRLDDPVRAHKRLSPSLSSVVRCRRVCACSQRFGQLLRRIQSLPPQTADALENYLQYMLTQQ